MAKALHHALAAKDFERTAGLAEFIWQHMEETFQSVAWLGWVKKLPEATIRSRPLLCFQIGRAFSDAGHPEISEIHQKNAERALAKTPSHRVRFAPLPRNIALTGAHNTQVQGDMAETIQYAEQAMQPRRGRGD